MTETRSLHRKLAQVMFEAERIPKRGKAPAIMGGYPFVQVGDAADYIRKALAEHLITMMPTNLTIVGEYDSTTKAGGSMHTVELRMDWTITDGESGESIVIQSYGAGADAGDKYSGKAQTNAMKYALLMGFLLSTGDDVELSDVERGKPRAVDEAPPEPRPELERRADGLIGTVSRGASPADLELRRDPDGTAFWGFKVKNGKIGYQAFAVGPLAESLALANSVDSIEGESVEVWGRIEMVPWRKGDREMPPFARIRIEKVKAPAWIVPAEVEPDTVPMFDDEVST